MTGDRYAAEFCSSEFERAGLYYKNSELNKSEIYGEFLPLIMQGKVELLDFKQQIIELRQLERRTGKGRDSIDHPQGPHFHDDTANCCALAATICNKSTEGGKACMRLIEHSVYPDDDSRAETVKNLRRIWGIKNE